MIAKFYVCGGQVESYVCEAAPPSQTDLERIGEIKLDLLRNFGYAPVVQLIES